MKTMLKMLVVTLFSVVVCAYLAVAIVFVTYHEITHVTTAEDLFEQSREYKKKGLYDKEIKTYTEIIQLEWNPVVYRENPLVNAYFSRAELYAGKKNYEMAIQDYNRCLELKPKFYNAFEGLTKCYASLKNDDMEKEVYVKFVEQFPTDSEACNQLAQRYKREKKYDMAIQTYTTYLEALPTDHRGYKLRANLYREMGFNDLANADDIQYERNKKKPEEYQQNLAQGDKYYGNIQYNEAITAYTQAIKADSTGSEAYKKRAELYERDKNYSMAIQDYSAAIDIETKYHNRRESRPELYEKRARLFAKIENDELAIQDYSRFLEIDSSGGPYGMIYRSRADLYKKLGYSEQANADNQIYKIRYEETDKKFREADHTIVAIFLLSLVGGIFLGYRKIKEIVFVILNYRR